MSKNRPAFGSHSEVDWPAGTVARLSALPVFYSEAFVANIQSFSPSAGKPAEVAQSWASLGIPLEVRQPVPVTIAQFCAAHDPDFVRGVLTGSVCNGFNNTSASVARALPYTSGAMLSAAREALANLRVAIAPVSGFHHAGFDYAGGYCTFNGLMVTAAVLLAEGVGRVGIVDFDVHYGDGTDDIIDRLMLGERVNHISPTKLLKSSRTGVEFLDLIPAWLNQLRGVDLVLYQAGADPHIDDPLGGWLTTEELRMRDRLVFRTLAVNSRGNEASDSRPNGAI